MMRSGRSAMSVATACRDVVVRHPAAAVDVGEQADAHAVERGGQARDADRLPRHHQLMALVEISVRARPGGGADAGRDKPLEHACGG